MKNINKSSLQPRQNPVWNPCSNLASAWSQTPLTVHAAQGSYLSLADGRSIIDACSSWWCKPFGHGEPRLQQALLQQLNKFEHVLLANTTNSILHELSAKLLALAPQMSKVYYASDGANAIEIAMKMSLRYRQLCGQTDKTQFIALKNAYHGETLGALSVTELPLFRAPYTEIVTAVNFLEAIPYVHSVEDPLWHDCSAVWPQAEAFLLQHGATCSAIVVEPIVQGAGGMRIYSQDFLRRLRHFCYQHDIHLLCDEIMTGLGRTGLPLASQHAAITPDFICLGKALTAGWLPMSAVLVAEPIVAAFWQADNDGTISFIHSHTYSGNALAASVAVAHLNILLEEHWCHYIQAELANKLQQAMLGVAHETQVLTNVRGIGGIVAADIKDEIYVPAMNDMIMQHAIQFGAYLRPLAKTIYWLPPFNIADTTLRDLQAITTKALHTVYQYATRKVSKVS